MTPIKMPNLNDDDGNEMDDDRMKKYLDACKSVEYVQVDGLPGLILHRVCACSTVVQKRQGPPLTLLDHC